MCVINKWFLGIGVFDACETFLEDSLVLVVNVVLKFLAADAVIWDVHI